MVQDEAVVDPTVVTGTFLLDNSYACILFDSGAERSFISHKFKHLLKHKSQPLNETFTVEMANENKESTNDVFIGCILILNDYSFPIDLVVVSIKSFDAIVDMDWISPNRANILCYEKAIRLNLPNVETLHKKQTFSGDKNRRNWSFMLSLKRRRNCLVANSHCRL